MNYAAKNKASKAPSVSFDEKLTKMFIEALEKGVMPWQKDFVGMGAGRPTNMSTGKPYRGSNAINLMFLGMLNDFKSQYFLTFNQAKALCNAKGESSNKPLAGQKAAGSVVFWGVDYKDKNGKRWSTMDGGKRRYIPTKSEISRYGLQKRFTKRTTAVFAFEQMDQSLIPEKLLEKRNLLDVQHNQDELSGRNAEHERWRESVQKVLKGLGIEVETDKFVKSPHYLPSKDVIVMPSIDQFNSDSDYYAVLLHECAHATGHKSRLDRETLHRYGESESIRAEEELVAEMTCVLMSLELGVKAPTIEQLGNHMTYVGNWATKLKEDVANNKYDFLKKCIKQAENASNYMMTYPELAAKKEKRVEDAELTI